MSGIAGFIRFDGAPVPHGLVEKMTSAMSYRGPDGVKHWAQGSVALGQCMLRTTPESLDEQQPLANEDQSLVLVMDGRVDNWLELRQALLAQGAMLRDRSDAELVLRAYETWGRDCLPHIDGDFAFVIWDSSQRKAFCARDRLGIRPFHYHWDGTTFAFASELHPILGLPWVPRTPNLGMLAEFLADEWYSRDETLWLGIQRLAAANFMLIDESGPRPAQYWAPDLWKTLPYSKDEEYFEHYRELLFDSVRRLSRSHRPVACEVSGGLDSSAVLCIAERLRVNGRLPAPRISGYTMAFNGDSEANELNYARSVGAHLGLHIHEIPPAFMPLSWYTKMGQHSMDFPGYPNGLMHLNLYRRAAAHGAKVLLTGVGGDHWLEGSTSYYAEELTDSRWPALRDCFAADARTFGARRATTMLFRHGFLPLLPEAIKATLRPLTPRPRATRGNYWLSTDLRSRLARRRAVPQAWRTESVNRLSQRSLLSTLYYPFDAIARELCERLGASSGLELRHPFLTASMVQQAFSTPERLRLRGGTNKFIHRRALKDVMPKLITERLTKADFAGVPAAYLNVMKREFSEQLPRERHLWLDRDGMSRLYQSYQDDPGQGWQNWAMWSIFAADKVLP